MGRKAEAIFFFFLQLNELCLNLCDSFLHVKAVYLF